MPDTALTSLQLTRTGRQVAFLDLGIGEAFYYQGVFWTRTDRHVGTDLRPRSRDFSVSADSSVSADFSVSATFGSCEFGVQDDTLIVEAVSLSFA